MKSKSKTTVKTRKVGPKRKQKPSQKRRLVGYIQPVTRSQTGCIRPMVGPSKNGRSACYIPPVTRSQTAYINHMMPDVTPLNQRLPEMLPDYLKPVSVTPRKDVLAPSRLPNLMTRSRTLRNLTNVWPATFACENTLARTQAVPSHEPQYRGMATMKFDGRPACQFGDSQVTPHWRSRSPLQVRRMQASSITNIGSSNLYENRLNQMSLRSHGNYVENSASLLRVSNTADLLEEYLKKLRRGELPTPTPKPTLSQDPLSDITSKMQNMAVVNPGMPNYTIPTTYNFGWHTARLFPPRSPLTCPSSSPWNTITGPSFSGLTKNCVDVQPQANSWTTYRCNPLI